MRTSQTTMTKQVVNQHVWALHVINHAAYHMLLVLWQKRLRYMGKHDSYCLQLYTRLQTAGKLLLECAGSSHKAWQGHTPWWLWLCHAWEGVQVQGQSQHRAAQGRGVRFIRWPANANHGFSQGVRKLGSGLKCVSADEEGVDHVQNNMVDSEPTWRWTPLCLKKLKRKDAQC